MEVVPFSREFADLRSAAHESNRDHAHASRYWTGATFHNEWLGRERICNDLKAHAPAVGVDAVGSRIAHLNGKGNGSSPWSCVVEFERDRLTGEPIETKRRCSEQVHPHKDRALGKVTKRQVYNYMLKEKREKLHRNGCVGTCSICFPVPGRGTDRELGDVAMIRGVNGSEIVDKYGCSESAYFAYQYSPEQWMAIENPRADLSDVDVHAVTHFANLVDAANRKYHNKMGIEYVEEAPAFIYDGGATSEDEELDTVIRLSALEYAQASTVHYSESEFSYDEMDDASEDETWSVVSDEDERWDMEDVQVGGSSKSSRGWF